QCEYYALEGLSALLGTIEQIRVAVNPPLEIEGILRTMFDPRNNLANEVSAQLLMHFGDKESRGALSYLALAGEMIRREEEETRQAAAVPAESPVAAEQPADAGTD